MRQKNRDLFLRIRSIFAASDGTYCSPRLMAQLRNYSIVANVKHVGRLMRINDLHSVARPSFNVKTTYSDHGGTVVPRLFEAEFAGSVIAPNQLYVGGIICLTMGSGLLLSSVFMDILRER